MLPVNFMIFLIGIFFNVDLNKMDALNNKDYLYGIYDDISEGIVI